MIRSLVAFLGRALLSIIFISSAINIFSDWDGTMHYFNQGLTNWLALSVGNAFLQQALEWGLAHAFALLLIGTLLQLVGGLMVFFGLCLRLGSLLLLLFLVFATLIFHDFWQLQGPDRQMQMINFMKNLSIGGGLLYMLAMGKGGKCTASQPTVS